MSNGRALRRRYGRDGFAKTCVFCEMRQLTDHVLRRVVPAIGDNSDREYVTALVASIRRDLEAIETTLVHQER